ncbi:MAG TPA: helix-turn-helix transcriptional regulator [Acidimicrobiales bacterium]
MKDQEVKNQSLGELVRSRRLAHGMSLADASAASGIHHSYWSKLENGKYRTPAPRHLQTIAKTLDIPIEDLYNLAGYGVPDRLPTFTPYLRAKYDLPPEAIADLERYFEMLRKHYGIPENQPVFPPMPSNSVELSDVEADTSSRNDDRKAA